jgi:hypothetical protein
MQCPKCSAPMVHESFEDWIIVSEDGEEAPAICGRWVCECGHFIADWEDDYEEPTP